MGFVANSRRFKDPHIERWREVLANFIVDPEDYATASIETPYIKGQGIRPHNRGIILKDAETHKAIMTYASRLVLTVLGDSRGEFIRANPVGWEDAGPKSETVTRLLRYSFALPGVFRTMVEAVVDMLLFGTAVVEINWRYQEREQPVRSIQSFDDFVSDDFARQTVVAYDDPTLTVVDHQDFYPDPGQARIEDMAGVAKGFEMNALKARELADAGIYKDTGVKEAIASFATAGDPDVAKDPRQEQFREGLDQPEYADEAGDFGCMRGIEYWGEVPWGTTRDDEIERSASRRVVTLLNGIIVRDDPYPLADADLPFRAMVINPVCGRFYGISPAEVIRYDQSLQDAIKILLAEAIIRTVHPPITYDIDSEIDLNKLRRFSPDVPIGIRGGPNSIGTLKYDANVFNGFSETAALKQSMQEASGALSVLQGQGLPHGRASATEAGFAAQQSISRPEMAAVLLERDAMPLIGKSMLRRYQQFLGDNEDLALRIGELPESAWVGDILGDYDIIFSGSRLAMSKQEKLQSYDRLVALSQAIPEARLLFPWLELLRDITGDTLELPEVAAKIGTPEVVQQNMQLLGVQNLLGAQGGAGNNGVANSASPAGQLPAQAGGNVVG